jgi:uncharacterized protein
MKKLRLVIFSLFFLWIPIWATDQPTIARLNVRGEAVLFKPADQVELTLGVTTQGKETVTALQENNQRMNQVIEALKTIGLDASDYQTGRFNTHPIYQHLSENDKSKTSPLIDYYEVNNSIEIKTQKLDLLDQIINVAVKSGANQLNQIKFDMNNPQAYRTEVIQLAVQNALNDAQTLAQASQVRLVRLLDISLDQSQNQVYRSFSLAKMESSDSTPIKSGNIEIHAFVQAAFEIAPY